MRIVLAVLLFGLTACRTVAAPAIRFAPENTDPSQVRRDIPLTANERAALTPKNLQSLTQDQVNQIYARLTPGPIPDGPYDGDLFFPRDANHRARLRDVMVLPSAIAHLATLPVERLARALWRGKVFYRSQGILRNRIEDLAVLKPLLRDDDTIPRLEVDGRTTWLLFPARVACGPSRFDPPHQAIVLDYSQAEGIEGYREIPDKLAGRERLNIRDEIRLVRHGFYLGRVYFGEQFALNFTLLNAAAGSAGAPDAEPEDRP
jgi:hypothetical protein